MIESNAFISRLWNICETVHREGIAQVKFFLVFKNSYYVILNKNVLSYIIIQPITLNIMRVDYFLDSRKLKQANERSTVLSNIELNTLGCGACTFEL